MRFHDEPLQGCHTVPNSDTVKPNAARSGSLIRRVESIAKPAEPRRRLGRFCFSARGKGNARTSRASCSCDADHDGSGRRQHSRYDPPGEPAGASCPACIANRPRSISRRRGGKGRIVIFHRHVARRRSVVVRTGWNNAAWGQPRRRDRRGTSADTQPDWSSGTSSSWTHPRRTSWARLPRVVLKG
jgi:hypothetical protein